MDRAKLVAEHDRLMLTEFEIAEPEWTRTNREPFATMPCTESEVKTDGENPQHVGVINAWGGAILRGHAVGGGRPGRDPRPDTLKRHASVRFSGQRGEHSV